MMRPLLITLLKVANPSVLKQSSPKWVSSHEQGQRPGDPRMVGALFEKYSASLRIKVLFEQKRYKLMKSGYVGF